MVHCQALTIRQALDTGRALQLMQAAADVAGVPVADMVQGCALFEIVDGAQVVGAFAARVDHYSSGREITVTAAGAQTAAGSVEAVAAWADEQAERIGADSLTCTTRRRGMVRKLEKLGFECAGYVMTKKR
jgi:hypothetical protein